MQNNSKCRNLFNRRNGRNRKKSFANHLCFDIKEIFIVGHYDCGVALTSSKDILHNMRSRGVSEQQLKLIEKDFQVWLDPYTDPTKNVLTVIKNLRQILLFPMIYLSTDLSLTPIRVNLIFWQMAIKRFKTNRALCF